MIKSFGDKLTARLFHGQSTPNLSPALAKQAVKKLDMINLVTTIEQLSIPPGNRLEKLSGRLTGYYSIRINAQYRIIFQWVEGNAYQVQVTDYH